MAISKTVYTNHTLVGAGNLGQPADLLKAYSEYYAQKMGISVDKLLEPGLLPDGKFNPTQFALKISHKVSAVSQLHYRLCQEAWPQYNWVGITNGVFMPEWQDSDIKAVANEPSLLWSQHQKNKKILAEYVLERTGYTYDPQKLVLTWSRRITGYKQLGLLFSDLDRLHTLMNQSGRPVQLLVAGKAHAFDVQSKQLIQQIIHHFATKLSGSALFIPNYDIDLARHLVRGSDVWLNTPEYGMEASGTSGMKAISNGVLQMTVPDGWAAEVEWPDKGWQLDPNNIAESFYSQLEESVIPLYWQRDAGGVPQEWVKRMQMMIQLSEKFSTARLMHEYLEQLYEQ